MEETSLDDFVGDAASAEATATETESGDFDRRRGEADAAGGSHGIAEDAPTVTAAWSPGGGTCGACGESAEWRWRDGDALVCADCKDW